MSHLILYIACSLDGYIARPNGSVDWLDAFNQAGGEDYGYGDLLRRCGAIIMGANT
jgi:dihydrofolate reductase